MRRKVAKTAKSIRKKQWGCLLAVSVMAMCLAGCGTSEESGTPTPTEAPIPEAVATSIPEPTVTPTAIPESTATPTPAAEPVPTVTPIPAAEPTAAVTPAAESVRKAAAQEDGMLSKPEHPENDTNDKLIFIGDSRTVGIRDAVNDNSIWSCRSAMGYEWMTSTGVPQIEDEIDEYTSVIILMGVNDVYQINNYVSYINNKANEWADLGASTYFVSVGPVENDPYVTNAQIESFNSVMEANLSGVTYIDLYSHLVSNGFYTVDGIHYPDSVSIDIYNYILDSLEETRSGIWG